MTKTKLAFVRCRLSCFSRRPVRFFPRLFPFACLLLFACRRFRCPALGLAGFFPRRIFRYRLSVFLSSFPSRRPVCFFPRLFPFAGISLPCLSFPSSLFVSGLSFLLFSSLFSPFCFFFFTGKRQAVVRPADMAAVWRCNSFFRWQGKKKPRRSGENFISKWRRPYAVCLSRCRPA